MASRSNHPVYRNGGGDNNDDLESGNTNYHAMPTQQLERRREEDLARHEGMLDQIHTGVQGLNHHARAINSEVEGQNVLIDDIGNRVDRAQQEIERQDAVARLVNAQKKKVRDEGALQSDRLYHAVARCRRLDFATRLMAQRWLTL